ncbi:diacylglycerol kinase family protein [Pontixanthobacter sp. CEM42]|uniref:diacylglycerol/lipid kinase family protein n=1 Tax=Pontixanthobacter sp. CEM42 TaxID=2792077 RepID=UPI001AE01503|nr:diacylglycerol kinase family protein [Pontixanthobacter sp. CEM42]
MTGSTANMTPSPGGDSAPEPVVGVIYNARSHRNRGRYLDAASMPNVYLEEPATHPEISAALAQFVERKIDLLVINGGDGTVRDVLTCGRGVFGDNWPALAVLPKGKTNALNVDLGAPSRWTLPGVIAAYKSRKRKIRRPLVVSPIDGDGMVHQGFILGAGGFTLGVRAGQDAHKMGAFNSLAVGVTSAWGILQGLLGSDENVWRRGVALRLLLGDAKQEVPHSAFGDPERRVFMLSSTLEKFPVGLKLFGKFHEGLKLVVLDHPRRRTLALMPAILSGWLPKWLPEKGVHHAQADHYEMDVGDEFILDGEVFPAGHYTVSTGPALSFVVP